MNNLCSHVERGWSCTVLSRILKAGNLSHSPQSTVDIIVLISILFTLDFGQFSSRLSTIKGNGKRTAFIIIIIIIIIIMAEDLFIPYHSHLPQPIQDEFHENEVWKFTGNFENIVEKGWTFDEFYTFVKDRIVFLTPNTAIYRYCDTPSNHEYTIDIVFIFSSRNNNKKRTKTFHISGVDAQATSPTLNYLFRFVLASNHSASGTKHNNDDEAIEVIFKCFATTPRKKFASLDLSFLGKNKNLNSSSSSSYNKISLSFQFLALDSSVCQAIFNQGNSLSSVEFRQCKVDDWMAYGSNDADDDDERKNDSALKINGGSQKLIISCTQHEFRKFAESRLLSNSNYSFSELHLFLHFIFGEEDIQYLTSTILNSDSNQHLERLCIEYLDLDDKSWTAICKSLHNHPSLKVLTLTYTENFKDSYRRLTPDRRRSRTDDILLLVNTNKILQEVNWPKFQQDESLITDIEQRLAENNKNPARRPKI